MADEEQKDERTLPASQRRREQARERGDVAKSRELISAAMILGAALWVYAMGEIAVKRLIEMATLNWSLAIAAPASPENLHHLFLTVMSSTLWILVPIVGFFGVIVVAASIGQYGLIFTGEGLTPNWGRIDPFAGFSRLFSLNALFEFGKTFFKFLVIGFVVYIVTKKEIPALLVSIQLAPNQILMDIARVVTRLLFFAGLVVAVIGAADYGFQWWEHEKKLRMTPQELKEEQRQTEGNPLVKARIRSIQRQMARKRMMTEVPKAAVVITNPTHLAIALSYDPSVMGAPRVVAKGAGFIAQKIREVAMAHGVPLIENKPLAQTLFKTVSLGGEIPSNLYRAVAEILVYVYKLRGDALASSAGR
jgi:flagellar biosynthetic protein FlhB